VVEGGGGEGERREEGGAGNPSVLLSKLFPKFRSVNEFVRGAVSLISGPDLPPPKQEKDY